MSRQKIKIVTLRKDYNFPPEVFVPLKSGKFLDKVISKKGGTMPGTITVVVGEPGSGKTTLLIDKLSNIESNNKDKSCLYISSEMNPLDNEELSEELPQLQDVQSLYLSDYNNPKEAMEDTLAMGWDYILLDSFADTLDKIKGCKECKMTATAAETWLIDLLVENTKGNNDRNKYTAFDVIQHITKGGTYKGSTKVEHNTTAMLFVKVNVKTNERYLFYKKNRRGGINKKLYMNLVDGTLSFDKKRYEELEKALVVKKEIDDFSADSEKSLFDLLDKDEFNVSEGGLMGEHLQVGETV